VGTTGAGSSSGSGPDSDSGMMNTPGGTFSSGSR
jgi:hypothetical protein